MIKTSEPYSSPREPIPVEGAYEVFEGKTEHLITLTRNGELLRGGDILPVISGVGVDTSPLILHTVNAFGTETCDKCTTQLDELHRAYPGVPVYSLTKQTPEEIAAESAKMGLITHPLVTIDQETAIDLGVALAPSEGADPEFWPTALRRAVIVTGKDGRIVHIEQPDDQEQIPDFEQAYKAALAAQE